VARTREQWIERLRDLLERAGFYVTATQGVRPSSFDLAARRDATLLLVKVLKNIDALDAEEAARLRELGRLFPAIVIVVGQTSGASQLDDGVVYTRYDVPIVTEDTLRDYLEKAVPPFLYASPGGSFAQIDGERLKFLRRARGLSLGALAQIAGVSRRAVQLYEEGQGAEATVVERIETYLDAPIVRPIELFVLARRAAPAASRDGGDGASKDSSGEPTPPPSTGDPLRDGVLAQLGTMGLEVTITVRAPFDALARTPEILLTGVGSLRAAVHRAEVLHGIARVAEGHAMFVVRETVHRPSIGGLAILNVSELRRHRDPDELLEDISERERP